MDIKEPTAHEVYERAIQEVVDAEVKDLWALGLERGYVGLTYDAQEEKKLKVKARHQKERERRKEQREKRVPYEPFVTLKGLQGYAHLNGQRGRVMKKRRDTGHYPVKLGNGTMLSVKAENMIREGTKGAEGKNKGNERKELELKRRCQRKLKEIRSAHTHWMKDTAQNPTPGRDKKTLYQLIGKWWNFHLHGNFVKSYAANETVRGKFE